MASNSSILADDTAAFLKCSICEGYLSVGPVMISADGTKYQCGRCNFTNANINIRNLTYEKIAVYLKFPCIYEGCKEKIAWGDVKLHELRCQFRTFRCIIDNCDDDLNVDTVINHFEKYHPDSIMISNATLPFFRDNKLSYSGMLIDRNVPYFFIEIGFHMSNADKFCRSFLFNVYTFSARKKSTYTVTFSDCKASVIIGEAKKIIARKYVTSYKDRSHCVGCFFSRCNIKFHSYSNLYGRTYASRNRIPIALFESSLITSLFNSSNTYYCITIEADSPRAIQNETLIRKTVECPICKNYMEAPIYSCITGHVVCKMCKERLTSCPTCREDIATSRNFSLEELCESIRLPCENKGCHEIDYLKNLQVHENNCQISNTLENPSINP